jgi:hypothetical protein
LTRASREQHINQALVEYRSRPGSTQDTTRVPLRGHSTILEVIEVPLDMPILNADSFRIAPALEDHPLRDVVRNTPESVQAQDIVADLVRKSHRHADLLKESLLTDGQDQPGIITRSGKLLNANTRCVLLRELVREGKLSSASLRVAVLPADITNSEELALESVLQQQQEFKDEYNLVSKLMMIRKLYTDGGMSDKQIAASLREKAGARRIAELREVLVLMERARHLSTDPRPLSAFVSDKDQQQNWLELLKTVRDAESLNGREAANDAIRGWLVAFYSGYDSVHHLRSARGSWVEKDVVAHLSGSGETGVAVVNAVKAPRPKSKTMSGNDETPVGLDLLGGDAPAVERSTNEVQQLLDLVVQAKDHPDDDLVLPSGEALPSSDIMTVVRNSVRLGLDDVKRRASDQNRLTRPQTQADGAERALKGIVEALDEVIDDPDFGSKRDDFVATFELIEEHIEDIRSLLGMPATAATDDIEGLEF